MNGQQTSDLNSRLWSVIELGNAPEAQRLIAKGADPNWRGRLGRTAVHRAALLNCPEEFDLLIDAGGVPDAIDDDKETPLHLAALHGHVDIIERLLKLRVDNEQRSEYGTPLDRAASGGHAKVIAVLLNDGATITTKSCWGRTPLHEAVARGRTDAARLLLRRGAEVDAVDQFGNNQTPLDEAMYPGATGLVQLLLVYGADFEHRNNWGATPLHLAARTGAADVVDMLLRAGADRNAKDQEGRTPFDEATKRQSDEVVSLLSAPPTKNHVGLQQPGKPECRPDRNGNLKHQPRADFNYRPDGKERVRRNDEAMRLLGATGPGCGSAKEIASQVRVLSLSRLFKLERMKRQQDIEHEMRWLSPDDEPLLVIFVSHRWEHESLPDPYSTQLWFLKAWAEIFIDFAVGLRERRNKRLQRISTLDSHGPLQAAYFAGSIAGFLDGFQGDETALRQQLARRVGIVYDYMSLPQKPRTTEEQVEFVKGMSVFRRLMASTPVLVLRCPDDEYTSRSWCELELWSAGKLEKGAFATAAILRMDLWGKEIGAHNLGPPSSYNSYADFSRVLTAISAWEGDQPITAEAVAGAIMRNYHLAFSLQEKQFRTPLITRPDFRAHNESDISTATPSFKFWSSVREFLCIKGLENQDFAEILKDSLRMEGIACTEEHDLVTTGLWLLGCHESSFDYGFMVFYGRCLLRHLYEGKDLKVRVFLRLPNQLVHFKFADGEEALEG